MCDYCDCRCIAPIGELSDEHQVISALAAQLRQQVALADQAAASRALRELQVLLGAHLAKEEAGIFAQLPEKEGLQWYLGELRADHARARSELVGASAAGPGWTTGVLAALDELARHIEVEEYDLFPACRVIIDDEGWAQVLAAHQRLAPLPSASAAQARAPGPAETSHTSPPEERAGLHELPSRFVAVP
jgi:hemerythrin-like domain-containing protein